jgi:hypothetical protein
MARFLSNTAEILDALSEEYKNQDALQGQRNVADLLFFVDEQFGPDFCMLVKICILNLGHLTKGKMSHGCLTVRSTAAFDKNFGYPFKVKMDIKETRRLFFCFDTPNEWPR